MECGAAAIILNYTVFAKRIIKIYRLRWVGQVERIEEGHKSIFYQKSMGRRKRRRPRSRFRDLIEEDLGKLKIGNWKARACNI